MILPKTIEAPTRGVTVLARVGFFNRNGDEVRSIVFKPANQGRNAHEVGSKDQLALVRRVAEYFKLTGPVDERTIYGLAGKPLPPVIGDPNHPVVYTPMLEVYSNPRNVWTITLLPLNRGSKPTFAYEEDNGEFSAYFLSTLEADIVATAAAAKPAKEKAEPKAPRGPVIKTLADLPLDGKPSKFTLPGVGDLEVKVFGKTHREKANPDGAGRVPDPETPRTAKDDIFTYSATHYQLGKVKSVHVHPKAVFIVAQNGLGILQVLKKSNKEEWEKFVTLLAEKGQFKGAITDIK